MRLKALLILSVCLCSVIQSEAATKKVLSGRVTDGCTSEPVCGAILQTESVSGRRLDFGTTDADGVFEISCDPDAVRVVIRCLGYEPVSLPIAASLSDVSLSPQTKTLKDVVVKAPDIYQKGDTLVYDVGKYANVHDDAIIDVIKRLPGIKVEDDGTILYNGTPINKFYIDGNDFIGGQYGLATDNIPHKDVKAVEVLENHQPVKALDDIEFSESAGINLKLKEDARQRWVGVAQGAAGVSPELFDGSVFAMRIAPKMQNMFTLKVDNTGWNPALQIIEHDYDELFTADYSEAVWPDFIMVDRPYSPLSESRTRDNLSWLANAISAWGSGDTSMRLKLNYIGDRLDYNTGMVTDYFSSSIPRFEQWNSLCALKHDLSGQFQAEVNKNGYYLKDRAVFGAVWDDSSSAIAGARNLMQDVVKNDVGVRNDLKLVKRSGKRLFTLSSRNDFAYSRGRIAADYYGDGRSPLQNMNVTDFRSTTEVKQGWILGRWRTFLTAGVDLDYHGTDAMLSGVDVDAETSGVCNTFMSKIYMVPQLDYDYRTWRLSVTAPVRWEHYGIDGAHNYISISPKFYVRKMLSAKSDLSASVKFRLDPPSAGMFLPSAVLRDYRNIYVPWLVDRSGNSTSVTALYRYRNPVTAFFANLSGSFGVSYSPSLVNQKFVGDYVVTTYSSVSGTSRMYGVDGGISKGFAHGRLVAGVDASVSGVSARMLRNDVVEGYRQMSAFIRPYVRGSLLRWLSLTCNMNYTHTAYSMNSSSVCETKALDYDMAVTLIPDDRWQFTLGCEHYFTWFPESGCSNLSLFDASASWQVSSRTKLSMSARNLLNHRIYRYHIYNSLSGSEYTFGIRPRNILVSVQVWL